MKSPQDMRIIQIDITNACFHRCSNCTRFCGHHKKPFFMDFETFKRAVDSFEGYRGTVGIMGGEPTLHPQFSRFLEYLNEHKYYPKSENLLVRPAKKFMKVIAQMEQNSTFINREHGIERNCVLGYGLWSALSDKYREYYELIQDTFNFQALNDHTNIMYHAPIMIRRKDMNIPDDKWLEIRDNCWAQKEWSATITPKGAFFCEIAGALDMLFDGPGGWEIEPGWWKRTPEQFGEQLKWCELCGIALNTFTRDANEEMDDMSPWWHDKLKELGSPKIENGMANILEISGEGTILEKSKFGVKPVRKQCYLDGYFARFNEKNDWLNPKGFIKCKLHKEDKIGEKITRAISQAKKGEFIVLMTEAAELKDSFEDYLKQYVLNPGSILFTDDGYDLQEELGNGILAVFSPEANAIKRATYPALRDIKKLAELVEFYEKNKQIPLIKKNFDSSEYKIEKNVRYALYGAGQSVKNIYDSFVKEQIKFICDSDCNKWGTDFLGYQIVSPEELWNRRQEFDKVFVSSIYFYEIKTYLMELGFKEEQIVTSLMIV